MNIAFVVNENYANFLYVAIKSILKNHNSDTKINFYIFNPDLTENTKNEILKLVQIKNCKIYFYTIEPEEELQVFWPWKAYNSRLCYYRLYLPIKMKELGINRYLYLDVDIIVNDNLEELYNTDLKDKALGLVSSAITEEEIKVIEELNLNKNHKYAYSGLMLVDVNEYITNKYYEKALEIAKNQTKDFYWPDMDILNLITDTNKYVQIPPKYSINPGFKGLDMNLDFLKKIYHNIYDEKNIVEAYQKPIIWQLAGGAKPSSNVSLTKIKKIFYNYTKNSIFKKQVKKYLRASAWYTKVFRNIYNSKKIYFYGKKIKIIKILGIKVLKIIKNTADIPQEKINIDGKTKCLVIAPHPDDEIIGMGGFLLKYHKNFDVLCISSSGVPYEGLTAKERSNIRIKEFYDVMNKIDINTAKIFETYGDNPPFISQIKKYLKDYLYAFDYSTYDYIFIPHFYDAHPEHRYLTNVLLKKILKQKKYKKTLKIVLYEVWSPLHFVNYCFNIDDLIQQKLKVLNMYKSQINETWNYPKWVEGLNSYRSMNAVPSNYVEAFYVCDVKDYLNYIKRGK